MTDELDRTMAQAPTCRKGHLLAETAYTDSAGYRRCRLCKQATQRAFRERHRRPPKPLRRETCRKGHPWTPENTYAHPTPNAYGTITRQCRICQRAAVRARRARQPKIVRTPAELEALRQKRIRAGKASARARRRKPMCRRGHRYTRETMRLHPNGARECRICTALAIRRRRGVDQTPGLVPSGVSIRHIKMWQTRRQRYGAAGRRADRMNPKPVLSEYCGYGHRYTPETTYLDKRGQRQCKTCWTRRQHAKSMTVTPGGVRVDLAVHDAYFRAERARLKRALAAAHPDKGGARTTFDTALKAYRRFMAQERVWYAAVRVAMPHERRPTTDQPTKGVTHHESTTTDRNSRGARAAARRAA